MGSCVMTTTNLGMEIPPPPSFEPSSRYAGDDGVGGGGGRRWSKAENKLFENALAVFDRDTPHRWERVSEMIPGKTVDDVVRQYEELVNDVSNIEAGLVPVPGYDSSPFTLEMMTSTGLDGLSHVYNPCGKRSSVTRPPDQERKKGIPWTEEEHRLFLMGLSKYGKGDWRNISRNFVISRTPTQVASHAQKFFIRQLSGGKDKRRASIHDITIVNLPESTPQIASSSSSSSPDDEQTQQASIHLHSSVIPVQWNQNLNSVVPSDGKMFTSSPTVPAAAYLPLPQSFFFQQQMMPWKSPSSPTLHH